MSQGARLRGRAEGRGRAWFRTTFAATSVRSCPPCWAGGSAATPARASRGSGDAGCFSAGSCGSGGADFIESPGGGGRGGESSGPVTATLKGESGGEAGTPALGVAKAEAVSETKPICGGGSSGSVVGADCGCAEPKPTGEAAGGMDRAEGRTVPPGRDS